MNIKNIERNSFFYLGIAIALHFFFMLFFTTFYNLFKIDLNLRKSINLPKKIEITPMNANLMKKYRSLGIKNGSKNFSLPIVKKMPKKSTSTPTKSNTLDFSKLKFDEKNTKVKPTKQQEATTVTQSLAKDLSIGNNTAFVKQVRRERSVNKMLKREMLQSSVSAYDQSIVKNTDLNMHFEPPEGVAEGELNSIEKRHYSFRKRAYENYVNGLLSTYHKLLRTKPHIANVLTNNTDFVTGKVVFDTNGSIISIKIIKWAKSDDFQEIFLTTLKTLSLANPPEELVGSDDQFIFYYSLQVKN